MLRLPGRRPAEYHSPTLHKEGPTVLARRPERQRVFINYSHQDNIGPDNPRSVTALEGYAALLQGTDRRQEADQMTARATAIRAEHQLPPPKE